MIEVVKSVCVGETKSNQVKPIHQEITICAGRSLVSSSHEYMEKSVLDSDHYISDYSRLKDESQPSHDADGLRAAEYMARYLNINPKEHSVRCASFTGYLEGDQKVTVPMLSPSAEVHLNSSLTLLGFTPLFDLVVRKVSGYLPILSHKGQAPYIAKQLPDTYPDKPASCHFTIEDVTDFLKGSPSPFMLKRLGSTEKAPSLDRPFKLSLPITFEILPDEVHH